MVSQKNKKMDDDFEPDGGEFSTIYGDLMSFCMFLFLMLYMMVTAGGGNSDLVQDVLKEISKSLKNEKQVEEIAEQIDEKIEQQIEQQKIQELKKAKLMIEITEYIKQEELAGVVQVEDVGDKITITLSQPVLFRSGKANLRSGSKRILNKLGSIFTSLDNEILIEGHTDNVPIHNKEFDSNWELSFYRAYNVVRYLTRKHRLSPKRLSVQGYGEYRPKVPNNSKANKAKNRRIEISILFKDKIDPEVTEKLGTSLGSESNDNIN